MWNSRYLGTENILYEQGRRENSKSFDTLEDARQRKQLVLCRKLYGGRWLDVCKKALAKEHRSMRPRIPSETIVEGLRPNNCKYFKKASFGQCSIGKPCYDNYKVFVQLVHDINPEIELDDDASLYVRRRVCKNTTGIDRHKCEDNLCANCSFTNYYIEDPSVSKKKADKFGAPKTFSESMVLSF